MKKRGDREAAFLEERIELLGHIETLQFGTTPISQLPMAEVMAHCQALVNENLSMPYDLRSKVLERLANHYMMEIKDCKASQGVEFEQYLNKYMDAISVWKPTPAGKDIDEMCLTASFIFEGIEEDIELSSKERDSLGLDETGDKDKKQQLPEEIYQARFFYLYFEYLCHVMIA